MANVEEAGGMVLDFSTEDIVHVRFHAGKTVSGADAAAIIRVMDARLPTPARLRVLVDAAGSDGFTLMARLEFVDWIRRNARRYRAACYRVPHAMAPVTAVIAASIPGQFRVFRGEAEARTWLAQANEESPSASSSPAKLRA